ncbi:hypothetical protein HDU93_007140 [Gonapodya sp. JEL0774]|nr:hypothetical protein HDU93_007140 [Gonapodya sp. JEL0774]
MSLPALSNDTFGLHFPHAPLTPITDIPSDAPTLQIPDWDSLKIGIAEYPAGPTGCTVFLLPFGSSCHPDVRGGSPGTLMAAAGGKTDAVVLTGGSCFGLESATGVTAQLLAQQNYKADWSNIPITRSAVVYDLSVRSNTIYPDLACGRAAVRSARAGVFPLGRRGAGSATTVGKLDGRRDLAEWAGQGGAYKNINGVKIAVFTVSNSVGALVDRSGKIVRGLFDKKMNRRLSFEEYTSSYLASHATTAPVGAESRPAAVLPPADGTPRNTTISLFVTNAKFEGAVAEAAFQNLVRSVHASMARSIQPFHLLFDGDVMFGVTTNELDVQWTDLSPPDKGPSSDATDTTAVQMSTQLVAYIAGELMWDAVLSSFEGESGVIS